MSEAVSAAIAIQHDTLRYAEIERSDDVHHVQRLGKETFPFDLARALLREDGDPEQTSEVTRVVNEVMGETAARELRIVVHPPDAYSFFTPISSDVPVRDRKRQLVQQAALVTGARSEQEIRMSSQTVRTAQGGEGEPFMWVHVLAVPTPIDERMEKVTEGLPMGAYSWIVSSEAAARVTSRVERTGGSAQAALRPYTLAIGQYPTHTEYALSRNREWYHAHYAEEAHSPENRAYYAVGFLNRIDVPLNGVGRLFVYGSEVELKAYAPFESIFDREPEVLDPFRVVRNRTDRSTGKACAYAPCIGGGMDEYVG